MKLFILLLSIIFVSCSPKNKVYLIKQWHLAPSDSATDILKSKEFPQYESQMEIYQKSLNLINDKKSKTIISEGCSGKIDKDFSLNFNGWSMSDLVKRKDLSDFDQILAPVPMKLKAKFDDKLNVICGDDSDLIKQHNLAFSDLKAFSGFFQRLNYYFQNDEKAFQKYLKAFQNVVTIKDNEDPVEIAKNKTIESLNRFENLLVTRNLKFTKAIIDNIQDNPILIIGGLHIPGISKILDDNKIEYEIITPEGYPGDDYSLFLKVRESIESFKSQKIATYYQVPEGFDPTKFPIRNLIPIQKLADKNEWNEIVRLSKIYQFDLKLLQSDYDKDGVRDFSVAKSPYGVVITAEDNDWDNDNKLNLVDNSISESNMYNVRLTQPPLSNMYNAKDLKENEILEFFNGQKLFLLESEGQKHDVFILKVLMEVMKQTKFDKTKLSIIHATKPKVSYGKQVFFSYINSSKTIEIYPELLFQYASYKRENDFKGADDQNFVNGFLTPMVVHSLAHELSHTIQFDIYGFSKKNEWTWDEDKTQSKYLNSFRNKDKKISSFYNFKFRGKTYSEWLEYHQIYIKTVNENLQKYKDEKEFMEKIKDLKWYVKSGSDRKELQLSFLVSENIPSLYSLQKPDEWVAEVMASCVFLKFYPAAKKSAEAIRMDLTIGLNPQVAIDEFCKFF